MIKITVKFSCIDYLLLDKVDILLSKMLDLFLIKITQVQIKDFTVHRAIDLVKEDQNG